MILNFSDKFEAGQTYYLWVRYEVAAGYEVSDDVTVTSDLANSTYEINTMRVKFQYTVPAAPKYTVTVTGGGTVEGKASVTTEAGTRLQLRAPEVSGKRFTGWSGLDEVTFYGDNAKVTDPVLGFIMPAKTFTVTANYQDAVEISTINIKGITKPLAGANPVNFGVTTDTTGLSVKEVIWYFDRTPSTNVPHDYEFQLGDKLYLLVFLDIADGYTFANSLTITADLEYTAAYRMPATNTIYLEYTVKEEMPTTYTVTFDSAGGSAVTAQSIEAGQEATKPADPTKDGYDFKGWTLNGSANDFNTAVNGNITLVATWEQQQVVPTTHTVTFDANGGSVTPASAETGADGKLTSLPTPTRSGSYSFNGWYTAASGGTKVTTSTIFNANTTIYAQWTYTGGSVVIIPDTDETDKSEPENPGTGAAVNPGTGAAVSGSGIGYACVALAAVGAIYVGAKQLAKKDEE